MQPYCGYVMLGFLLLPVLGIRAQQVSEKEVKKEERYLEAEREMILGNADKAVELYQDILRENPDNYAAAYQIARIFSEQEEYDKALAMSRKAVKGDRDNTWYRMLEADILHRMGRFGEAAAAYEALAEKQPDEALVYTQWAYQLVKDGQIKNAIRVYDKLEKQIGLTEEIIQRKHKLYLGMGDHDRAARELERLISAYPSQIAFRHELAEFYEQIGEREKARRVYRDILAIAPEDPEAQLALAGGKPGGQSDALRFLASLKPVFEDPTAPIDLKVTRILPLIQEAVDEGDPQLTAALLELTSILEEVHPEEAKGYAASADLLYWSGRREAARDKYARALSLDDTVYPVWEQYLFLLAEMRDFPALEEATEDALDIFPNQARIYYLAGLALQRQQKNEEAIRLLQQALLMTSADPLLEAEVQSLLGTVYNQDEKFDRADEAFARAMELMPQAPPVRIAQSLALARRGRRLDEAEALLEPVVQVAPNQTDLRHAQGWIAYKRKDYERAETHLAAALKAYGENDPVLLEHYGDLQYQRSLPEKALQYWKKAREAGNTSDLLEKKIADRQLYE